MAAAAPQMMVTDFELVGVAVEPHRSAVCRGVAALGGVSTVVGDEAGFEHLAAPEAVPALDPVLVPGCLLALEAMLVAGPPVPAT